jgi:hypothetical protein
MQLEVEDREDLEQRIFKIIRSHGLHEGLARIRAPMFQQPGRNPSNWAGAVFRERKYPESYETSFSDNTSFLSFHPYRIESSLDGGHREPGTDRVRGCWVVGWKVPPLIGAWRSFKLDAGASCSAEVQTVMPCRVHRPRMARAHDALTSGRRIFELIRSRLGSLRLNIWLPFPREDFDIS